MRMNWKYISLNELENWFLVKRSSYMVLVCFIDIENLDIGCHTSSFDFKGN